MRKIPEYLIEKINGCGATWIRKCPKCSSDIVHNNFESAKNCHKQKRLCSNCSRWNKGLTKETNESIKKMSLKVSDSMKKIRETIPPWNLGLSKENNEILKYISECRQGIRHSKETRDLIGHYTKLLWDSGYWGGRSSNEWHVYKNKVHSLTKKSITELQNYDKSKRGRCGIPGAYQIDHIIPIKYGFINNIRPEELANPLNLQFIPWEENKKKGISYDGKN